MKFDDLLETENLPYNLLNQNSVHRFFIHDRVFIHDFLHIYETGNLLHNPLHYFLYDLKV